MEQKSKKKRNAPWTKDELILALNLYFKFKPNTINQKHPEIIKLSEELNKLSFNLAKSNTENFRNPNSVYMKLCNFLRYDPFYEGVGLKKGSKLEKEVWDAYYNHKDELGNISIAIRHNIKIDTSYGESDEEQQFPEGRIIYRVHRLRERNTVEVRKLKEKKEKEGKLFCEVCGFDFYVYYGERGKGYIECHHDVPLSYYGNQTKSTKNSDLRLVCSNCHRILHRKRPWIKVDDLRKMIGNI